MEFSAPVLLIAVPLAVGLINILVPVILRKILTGLALVYTMYTAIIVWGQDVSLMMGSSLILAPDNLSGFVLIVINILSVLILLFSLKGIVSSQERAFWVLFPLTVSFSNGAVQSTHAFVFLSFWGLTGVTLYLFGRLGESKEAGKTAQKTLIIIGMSDALLLLGLVILGISGMNWSLAMTPLPLSGGLYILAFVCILVAALAKAGGFPFHTWLPDFSRDAPVESAALLPASLDKLLGIYLLARLVTTYFEATLAVHLILITLGALTVIFAVMMALIQHNGRRLLGYHAVSQVGYMIIGVGSGNALAFAGGLFHLVNNALYKSNLFLTLGSVEKQTGSAELDELGGLGRRMPFTFSAALIGALAISGIPPLNGFFSKWMIYQGLLDMTRSLSSGYQIWLLICLILAVFGSALTLASFLKFIHAIYLGRGTESLLSKVRESSVNQWLATGLLALVCVALGIFAVTVPLQLWIYPALTDLGFQTPEFLGVYRPLFVLAMMAVAFVLGWILYRGTRRVRYDDVYVGGMPASESFRILGTDFYREIQKMVPFKGIYKAAERQVFDLYHIAAQAAFTLAGWLKRIHNGQVQIYLVYILLGFLVFLIVL